MNNRLLSIIKSEMYINRDKEVVDFDIDKMDSFYFDFVVVPLFEERTDVSPDIFDLMFFGSFAIITVIWRNFDNKQVPVIASLSTTDPNDLQNNTYKIELEVQRNKFHFVEESSIYQTGYTLTVSYVITSSRDTIYSFTNDDILKHSKENQLVNIAIPFRKNGVWLGG